MKKTFAAIFMMLFIFSCSNAVEKDKDKKEEKKQVPIEKNEYSNELVYLDNEENIFNLLCQGWEMADDVEALEGMDDNSTIEISFRSLYLSPDRTFIKNPRNAMQHGNWDYNDVSKTITLNYADDGGKDVYKIASLSYDELIVVNVGIKSTTNLVFIASGKRFKNIPEEPYHISNNQWRLPPSKKEADTEIHRRLKENLHFFILFYKSAIKKDDKAVSFWGLPSCFTWYGGAIYMKNKELLKDNWLECFYDKEQAMKAYAIAEKLLDKKYEWPKGVSWLKQNLSVLEQMYKNMDQVR